jgi:hypothetical protein
MRRVDFSWKKLINYIITIFLQNHIDVEVDDFLIGKWRLTDFNGMLEIGRRKE